MTRKQIAGEKIADSIIELCHMMYNANTAKGVVNSCIARLQDRIKEFQPKQATEKYKLARYSGNIKI